jgi:hypothetical protein
MPDTTLRISSAYRRLTHPACSATYWNPYAVASRRSEICGIPRGIARQLLFGGDLSRNRQVGLQLAAGIELGRIVESTPMIAEGIKTTSVAMELAARHGVDLPIVAEMHAVLNSGRAPADAIKRLMGRTLRNEAV